jgi:hypothetical protein
MKKVKITLLLLVALTSLAKAQVIWSEDFANGIPAGWTNTGVANISQSNPSGTPNSAAIWKYTHQGTQGAYGSATDTIRSTTAHNGALIFDSDFMDNAGTTNNFGHGAAPANQIGILTTPVINCTGYNNVRLKFHQYFRNFYSYDSIGISNDGGVTWNNIAINANVATNSSTPKNDSIFLNISSYASNQANVKIRFKIDANYYFWLIDDIKVYSDPIGIHELNLLHAYDTRYANIPLALVDTINYFGEFANIGDFVETNVALNVTTKLGASTVFSGSSTPSGYGYTLDTFNQCSNYFIPNSVGAYTSTFSLSYDSSMHDVSPANLSTSYSYHVTDSTYSYDNGTITSGYYLYNSSSASPTDRPMGNRFHLAVQDTISTIGTYMFTGTVANTTDIQGVVYQFDGVSSYSEVCRTPVRTIAAADISSTSSFKEIKLAVIPNQNSKPVLVPGDYFVAIQQLNNTTSLIGACDVASYQSTALFYNGSSLTYYTGTEGSTAMVRAYFGVPRKKISIGVENINSLFSIGTIYPNPAKIDAELVLPIDLKNSTSKIATVKVYNAIGQTMSEFTQTVSNQINIATTGLKAGMYLYAVEIAGQKTTGRFSVVE